MILELTDERLYEVRRALESAVERTLKGLQEPGMAKMPDLAARAQRSVVVLNEVLSEIVAG